ncbi:phage terminase large subunit family protein [Zavarzinella formosa]|uniref:phage terminase large subunit family protein n=1 Tax=Zavarzinella formosa TaxID=360055 RepID=UPI0002DA46AB|nr:hypothetical protein [Zavarzinella formosa]
MVTRYFAGLDLGQARDYTAIAVLSRPRLTGGETKTDRKPSYAVPHLARFPLGTPYPEMVASVVELLKTPALRGSFLVVDQTGVGRAVVDLLADALRGNVTCSMCPVTTTGGSNIMAGREGRGFHVPKKELVGILQLLLQTRRLQIARSLPEVGTLVNELEAFRVKITVSANETLGAWRERDHDDLVLAAALAAWAGETALSHE